MKTKFIFWGSFLLLSSCNLAKKNELLKNANQLHLEAVEIQSQLETRLDSLKKLPQFSIKTDSLSKILDDWEENLVEVPGFEHEHKQGEHHSHKHNTTPEMSDQQMLEYQQNTKTAIEELRVEIKALTNKK